MPKKPLSITLIDAKTGETAGYQQDIPRYPASVVKMFWMVVLYAQIESGLWKNEKDFAPYLAKMLKESDNGSASFILDQVTGTSSKPKLKSEKFQIWKNKRQQVNRFFQQAGYNNISIIQKTFPIYYINLPEPEGNESQLLGNSRNWNRITTKHAARLLYEICYAKQAVSLQASKKMCGWLKRDLNPKVWQPADSYDFNPVRTFFGKSLPHTRVQLHSKAGWTSVSRTEAAMVVTENSKGTYILATFAQDSAYADDVEIFPKMSRLVYKRMTSRSSR
ncbi:serine hydrolase [Mastigocladopsis repens]|uniref:serine hydrolase n=1 Tax=Mastigocladopsis repens TaxID=221287 RepID=UPI001E3395C2|nr:serine hydrolase [Mastigocladopsis repens]